MAEATTSAGRARRDELAERTGMKPEEATVPSSVDALRRAPLSVWQNFAAEDPDGYAKLRDEMLYKLANAHDKRRRA